MRTPQKSPCILRHLIVGLLFLVAILLLRADVVDFRQGRIPTDPDITAMKFSIPRPEGMEWHGTQSVNTSGSLATVSGPQPGPTSPSFSGNIPFTGIAIDTFNITLSGQWIIIPSIPELYRGLIRYFRHYNHTRPHQSLDYKTPAEIHNRCAIVAPQLLFRVVLDMGSTSE